MKLELRGVFHKLLELAQGGFDINGAMSYTVYAYPVSSTSQETVNTHKSEKSDTTYIRMTNNNICIHIKDIVSKYWYQYSCSVL